MQSGTEPAPHVPLLWFISSASSASAAHTARLREALGSARPVIVASLDGTTTEKITDAVQLDLTALGQLAFRERLLWHIEQGNMQIGNTEGISRDTRATRLMLIGLGIFFAVLFGSLFHMSYYQI